MCVVIIVISVKLDPYDHDSLYGWGRECIIQWSLAKNKVVRVIALKFPEKRSRYVVRVSLLSHLLLISVPFSLLSLSPLSVTLQFLQMFSFDVSENFLAVKGDPAISLLLISKGLLPVQKKTHKGYYVYMSLGQTTRIGSNLFFFAFFFSEWRNCVERRQHCSVNEREFASAENRRKFEYYYCVLQSATLE